jgi:nucleotide-binding universal stress UspA family protein
MFKHILVPLDGSQMAEAALPVAVSIAKTFGSRITLFHVIERDAPSEVHGERHLDEPREAGLYLDEIASRVFPADADIECHVHEAPVSRVSLSIAEHVRELGVDLVVMCTHGRSGLKAFMFGRIAQQAAALSTTPVLFVHPGEENAPLEFVCRRLMVPLDGNPQHEEGLAVARGVAGGYGAEINLVMVIHNLSTLPGENAATARVLPRASTALLDIAQKDAEKYLASHAEHLLAAGIAATATVLRGDPVNVLPEAVEQADVDLVVLATHGKTGMEAFWSGSATPFLSRRIRTPLLLVPVREKNPE